MTRILELFCGIGGVSAAIRGWGADSVAVDINQSALEIYRLNFPHRCFCRAIESLSADQVQRWKCDTWWLSPPCQPHTRRGWRRDLDDLRSSGLRRVVAMVDQLRPPGVALENVPGFAESRSRSLLVDALSRNDYHWQEIVCCPTDWGGLNCRPRYYLIAARNRDLVPWQQPEPLPVAPRLETIRNEEEWLVPGSWLREYGAAIRVVSENDFLAGRVSTHCFTAAYGRSPVRSGAYLRTRCGVRFFTPREILWQLGFPEDYRLPSWPPTRLWPRVGNSISLPAVQYVLRHLISATNHSPPSDAIQSPVFPN